MIKNCSKTMKNVACDGFIQVGWVNFESKKYLACKTHIFSNKGGNKLLATVLIT